MKILVSICTRDRDELLERCLRELSHIEIPIGCEVAAAVTINSPFPAGSTLKVVEAAGKDSAFPIFSLVEPKEGIPFARNRGLDYALGNGYTHVAFIDDDGYPAPQWLVGLVSGLNDDVCASSGPQVPVYAENADKELIKTGFYDERKLPDGKLTNWAATNNVLANLDAVREARVRFDEGFANTGSSDKLFFMQLTSRTSKMIRWRLDAVVFEPVPQSRFNRDWLRKRAYRYGSTGFMIRSRVHPVWLAFCFCLLRSAHLIGLGCVKYALSLVGLSSSLKADSAFFHGLGFIGGLFPSLRVKKYV